MSTPQSYDAIVIGAGHNGLTAAGLLARRGRRVLVLERREIAGGMAASEEFHPGYRSAGLLHDTTGVRASVVKALGLESHGLRLRSVRPGVLSLGENGRGLMLPGEIARAAEEIGERSPRDAGRYLEYHAFLSRIREVLSGFLSQQPVDLVDVESIGAWELMKRGLRVRRLGKTEMMELLRLPPMAVADWLGEWFETDQLKAALALPAIAGSFLGPRSPGSNANLLLWEGAAGAGIMGGGPALVAALEESARASGVEIRTKAGVEKILVREGSVEGVSLAGGEQVRAGIVAASCDPRQTFLRLLPPGSITHRLEQRIRTFRARGTTAHVLLALNGPVRFACRSEDGIEYARTGSHLNDLERAFDAVKYRSLSQTPILDIHVPTVSSRDLAPAGHSIVSILVHFAPYDIEGGWDEGQRRRLGDRVVAILEKHAPGFSSSIVSSQVLSPVDLETRYGLTGGQIHHGEHSLDQILIRPVPECATYKTPLRGLFLCGSGSHPGGGLTCAPGELAAAAILSGS